MDRSETIRISFSAPFHTGIMLDFGELLKVGYSGSQDQVLRHISSNGEFPGRWNAIDSTSRESTGQQHQTGHLLFDPARIRGTTAIPRYFLRYTCPGNELHNGNDIAHAIAECQQDNFSFHIEGIRVRLYDYGFGSIVVVLEGQANRDYSFVLLKSFGEAIESQLNELFGELLSQITSSFAEATRKLRDYDYAFDNITERLLWTHRLYHLKCSRSQLDDFAFSAANTIIDLQYSILRDSDSSFVNSQNMRLFTGKGNSLVVTATDSQFDDTNLGLPNLFSRVLLTAGVFDAVTESLHQKLLESSNRIALESREGSIKQLEDISGFIIRHTQFISHIKALRSQYKFSLDANSLAIWNAIDGAWEAQERWQYVEDQNEELERLHSHVMAEMSRQQQRTLNLAVIFSLAVSVIATIVGIMAIFQQEFFQKVSVIVVSTVVVSIATVWYWRMIYQRKDSSWIAAKGPKSG